MWILILLGAASLGIAGVVYLVTRIAKFRALRTRFSAKRTVLIAALIMVLLIVIGVFGFGLVNTVVCLLYAAVLWLICDGAAAIVRLCVGRRANYYAAGIAALALTALVLGAGVFFAYHVFRTEYILSTDRAIGTKPLKIVGFSDSHIGTTFHGDRFAELVERMNAEHADLAVIVGDFVDDDSSYRDMKQCCEALGTLKTAYGVYYVFGNHDGGYFRRRGYDRSELARLLEQNGVTVLEDETVTVAQSFCLTGRRDASDPDRAPMRELFSEVPQERYRIVLDHQPTDYEAQAQAGADLVISGHTHGGQLIPINKIGEWLCINDATYGHKRVGRTDFIVSSGISDWALKFKTGCISEYFVINITEQRSATGN